MLRNRLIQFGINFMFQGIEEGWYDGGSIAFAVVLVIVVTGINLLSL